MIVKEIGEYRLLKKYSVATSFSTGTLSEGSIIRVTQIDDIYHKVIGPELKDWRYWDLPVEPFKED